MLIIKTRGPVLTLRPRLRPAPSRAPRACAPHACAPHARGARHASARHPPARHPAARTRTALPHAFARMLARPPQDASRASRRGRPRDIDPPFRPKVFSQTPDPTHGTLPSPRAFRHAGNLCLGAASKTSSRRGHAGPPPPQCRNHLRRTPPSVVDAHGAIRPPMPMARPGTLMRAGERTRAPGTPGFSSPARR